jgi:hypothetical protein
MTDTPHEADNVTDENAGTPVTMYDPAYWATHPDALREALVRAGVKMPPPSLVRRRNQVIRELVELPLTLAIEALTSIFPMMNPDEQSRLTLIVEEAAQRLGISGAFAYEAVRRVRFRPSKLASASSCRRQSS